MSTAENEHENFWIIVTILTSKLREKDTDMFLLLEFILLVLMEDKKEFVLGII